MTQIPKRLSEHPKVVTKNKTWEVEIIYSQAEGGKKISFIYVAVWRRNQTSELPLQTTSCIPRTAISKTHRWIYILLGKE